MSQMVVVTGAAGALGSAVSRELVSRGYNVAGVDSARAESRLNALQAEVGRAFWAVVADLGTMEGWKSVFERVQGGGEIVGAVLTVGGWVGGAPLTSEAEGTFEKMVSSNLTTVHLALRSLLPGMVERKQGSIVVVGSRAAPRPWTSAGAASYAASKAGAVALGEAAAAEVLESGVRINSILPSTMDTPANRAAMPDADPTRWVSTTSAAKVIAFLLSDDASAISGAQIPVYGRA